MEGYLWTPNPRIHQFIRRSHSAEKCLLRETDRAVVAIVSSMHSWVNVRVVCTRLTCQPPCTVLTAVYPMSPGATPHCQVTPSSQLSLSLVYPSFFLLPRSRSRSPAITSLRTSFSESRLAYFSVSHSRKYDQLYCLLLWVPLHPQMLFRFFFFKHSNNSPQDLFVFIHTDRFINVYNSSISRFFSSQASSIINKGH